MAHVRAKAMNVTADVMTRDSQTSTGYWEIVQDSLADLCRIMLKRCYDQENYPVLFNHCRNLRGQVWLCAFPNLFITIAPAEWRFPRPYFLQPYMDNVSLGAYCMALHMYYIVQCILRFLCNPWGNRWFIVYEWVCKTEYQSRGTEHWHIAAWVVSFGLLNSLKGRTGTKIISAFVSFLQLLFFCEIDVQIGNGRLNYINGYVSKDHDAVDVGLGEFVQKDATAAWLSTFRLLCKSSPGLPEVAIRMAQLSEFDRSYSQVLLYPPQPKSLTTIEGRQNNFSAKMYGFYSEENRKCLESGESISQCFLEWHRTRQYDRETHTIKFRGGDQKHSDTSVVSCRFWYELTDGFWGQFALVFFPHLESSQLLPSAFQHLESMVNFAGVLEYLMSWCWTLDPLIISSTRGAKFSTKALPFLIGDEGEILTLGEGIPDQPVFVTDALAYKYLLALGKRDLQYRGYRDDRIASFNYKQDANFLLYRRVRSCPDATEYEQLRQSWDVINRPKHLKCKWSPRQEQVLSTVRDGLSHEDEQSKKQSHRFLYVSGDPGSGKSRVLLETAIEACTQVGVLIICPTGIQVFNFKSRLPDIPGIENIRIDTIQGVLNYKRPGADSTVKWSPPSALRKIDLILLDEASQYEDREWERLYTCLKEQPHDPFCCIVGDFKQLQPVGDGVMCKKFCDRMNHIHLDTIYRSDDPAHLLFVNRIRLKQPTRDLLLEYFEGRHFTNMTLRDAVSECFLIAAGKKDPFVWLCCTNKGASEVCEAALECFGISKDDLSNGFLPDPNSQSNLRILAKPGLLLRLTRNFDKQRGFVNGALAEVVESLRGNAVIVARLIGTGNYVLIHPIFEDGDCFLPCCYGYATTIRRAQGSDLMHGCLYMEQKRPAARGYGYVGVSRFRTRGGCYFFGKLRRTDFLPVDPDDSVEVLERGHESVDSGDEDGCGLERMGAGEQRDWGTDLFDAPNIDDFLNA